MRRHVAFGAFVGALITGQARRLNAPSERLFWTCLTWGLLLVTIVVVPARWRYRGVTLALVGTLAVIAVNEEYDNRATLAKARLPAATVGR